MFVLIQNVKASVPVISPLLRSDLQGHLLALLLLAPDRERTVTEIAAEVGGSMPTVHREIERLVTAEFLTQRRSGRNRYIRANREHPLYRPVREIIEYAYGPRVVLPELLADVGGVEEAYVYGSWAARMSGEAGADPQDIDVLVVGSPDRVEIQEAASAAEARLGREVNMRVVSSERWQNADEPFLRTVKDRPLVRLRVESESEAP